MNNIHNPNSYNVWSPQSMEYFIRSFCAYMTNGKYKPEEYLNRSMRGMIIEWYLHNFGYWFTLPFIKNPRIKQLNERFKHLDLEYHF